MKILNPLGMTTSYTHKKKTYFATCLQWDGTNTEEFSKLLESQGWEVAPYGDSLMIRWQEKVSGKCGITTVYKGHWLRIGENGEAKLFTDVEFKTKYEEI